MYFFLQSDDSDDDIPLASLDMQKSAKQEKRPCEDFGSDSELYFLKFYTNIHS